MYNSARFAARSLRILANRLDSGEFDMVDLSQMCPTVMDGRHGRPLPVLVVNMVAWRATNEKGDTKAEEN